MGEGENPRAGANFDTPPQSESFRLQLHPSDDELQIVCEANADNVPNLLLLGPKTINLKLWIDYKTDCFNVAFPRSLMKSGMYYLSSQVNSDGDIFRATESEKHVDEGGM